MSTSAGKQGGRRSLSAGMKFLAFSRTKRIVACGQILKSDTEAWGGRQSARSVSRLAEGPFCHPGSTSIVLDIQLRRATCIHSADVVPSLVSAGQSRSRRLERVCAVVRCWLFRVSRTCLH